MKKRVLSVVFAAALLVGLFSIIPVAANATSGMEISDICVETIKQMEGFNAIPYWDYGQWTVGFGTACPSADLSRYQKEGIPLDEADALMQEALNTYEKSVNAFAQRNGLTLTQGQFDALVSMTYNLGSAMLYTESNRVYKAIMEGATGNELIFAFSVYCSAGGEFLPGLMRRRLVEANMYLNGAYDDYAPENYCYVLYEGNGGTRDVMAQGYDCNLAAVPMSVPTNEGYTFVGWYTAASGGTKVTSLDETTNGITLYAHWEKGESNSDSSALPDGGVEVTVTESAVNVRTGPGVSYAIINGVFKGDVITITGVSDVDGVLWGKFDKGWISLQYTNYAEIVGDDGSTDGPADDENTYDVPVKATVISTSGVTVYNGPHTTYPKVRTLAQGTEIEILEFMTFYDVLWGRYEGGWVQINVRLLLDDDQKVAHPFRVTVDYYYLNVRSGPGLSYNIITQLTNGTVVEIVAIEMFDGVPWGRCDKGWISLAYTDFDSSEIDRYRYHSYGDWYELRAATCTQPGQERRDCQYCTEHETRETALGDHSYGQWYETQASTCVTAGEERRDCVNCDSYETRAAELSDHSYGDWYETQAATCTVAGEERRDCLYCEDYETRETALAEHTYGQWYESRTGTCVSAGEERRDCQYCDAYETRETSFGDHSFGEWYETVAPTLEQPGEERRDCQYCDAFETNELPPVEHIFGEWYVELEATCTAAGEERRNCLHCELYESREIPAAGHSFGDWHVTKEATCTEVGLQSRECQICGLAEEQQLQMLEHTFGDWAVLAPATCTGVGTDGRVCDVCQHLELREVAMLEHTFGDWYVYRETSCAQSGEERRDCSVCGSYETNEIPAVEHTFGDWYVYRETTCAQSGEERRDCSVCGSYEVNEIPAVEHSFGDWYVYRETTCAQSGEERRDCSVCGSYEANEIPAVEHTFGDWYVYREASCAQSGEERRECSVCGSYEANEIPAVEHTFGDWYVSQEATCQATGEEKRECALCGAYETRELPIVKHAFGDWYIFRSATCSEEGEARRTCQFCEAYETRKLPLIAHSFGDWYVSKEATCVEAGEERRDCQNCDIYENNTIAITGHVFGDWYVSTAATCVAAGEERRDCQNCDNYETNVIAATGHVFGDWYVSTAATCAEAGEERRDCQNCDIYETSFIPITDHVFGDWYVSRKATCTVAGEERRDCQGCTAYETNQIPLTDHSYGDWYTYAAATCTSVGEERRDCQSCDRYESLELAMLNHSFGDWYVTKEATYTKNGEQRRDCKDCNHYMTRKTDCLTQTVTKVYGIVTYYYVNVRAGVGTNHDQLGTLCYGDRVEILEQVNDNGILWGRFSDTEWVRITDYLELETVTEQPNQTISHTYATVTCDLLNIRSGAGAGYDTVGALRNGDVVEILELVSMDGTDWGRIETGWICITGYASLETESTTVTVTKEVVVTVYGTVTYDGLNVRSGAGVGYSKVATLALGTEIKVLELAVVNGTVWGRIEAGWTRLDGYVELSMEIEEYISDTNHVFGNWYVSQAATCTENGLERRDCETCSEYETRILEATGHSYGEWYETKAPTANASGEQRRDCIACDAYETRKTEYVEPTDKIYAVITYDGLIVRSGASISYSSVGTLRLCDRVEILEQYTDGSGWIWGRTEMGWIRLDGYTILQTVKPGTPETKTMATVVYDGLNIRSGPNVFYELMGSLAAGEQVEIFAQTADYYGWTWGLMRQGWIRLDNFVELEVVSASGCDPHSFGTWYTVTDVTCTDNGQQRRDCSLCGYYETVAVEATGHSYGDWYVTKAATTTENGEERRDCDACDSYETRQTDRLPGDLTVKLYATVTADSLNIRSGPSTGYAKAGTLARGDRVEILEITRDSYYWLWGRTELGWIRLDGYVTLESTAHGYAGENAEGRVYATLTASYVNVRSGAGAQNALVGQLYSGAKVRVYEYAFLSDGSIWIRISANGWASYLGYFELSAEACSLAEIAETMTVDADKLMIYTSTAGTTSVGYLLKGAVMTVLEQVDVDGVRWGRIASGWVCLTGSSASTGNGGSTTNPPQPNQDFSGGVTDEWFENVLFIGDSRFVGLQAYARSGNATYFCDVGMSLFNYSKKVLSDDSYSNLSLEQLLATHSYDKVILNFGLNECGYPTSSLLNKYRQLIELIQSTQEDAVIIINGIMSVSTNKAAQASYFEPEHLADISEAFAALADGETIYYIDCNAYFTDSDGYLLSEYTSDGYHPNITGYRRWRDWMAYAIAQLGI